MSRHLDNLFGMKMIFKKVGNKITVDHNSLPYLLNLNDDPLYVDVLLYEIRPGTLNDGGSLVSQRG